MSARSCELGGLQAPLLKFLSAQRCESVVWDLKALRCGFADLGTRSATRARRHDPGDRQLSATHHHFLPRLHLLEKARKVCLCLMNCDGHENILDLA